MRRAAKVDTNQAEIVEALRKVGCSVQHLHTLGKGAPDILVGYTDMDGNGTNILMEIKTRSGKLTPDETKWHEQWRGQVYIVRSFNEAMNALSRSVG